MRAHNQKSNSNECHVNMTMFRTLKTIFGKNIQHILIIANSHYKQNYPANYSQLYKLPLSTLFPYTTRQRLGYQRPLCRPIFWYQFYDFIVLLQATKITETLMFESQQARRKNARGRKSPGANLLSPWSFYKIWIKNFLPSMQTLHFWSIREKLSCKHIVPKLFKHFFVWNLHR